MTERFSPKRSCEDIFWLVSNLFFYAVVFANSMLFYINWIILNIYNGFVWQFLKLGYFFSHINKLLVFCVFDACLKNLAYLDFPHCWRSHGDLKLLISAKLGWRLSPLQKYNTFLFCNRTTARITDSNRLGFSPGKFRKPKKIEITYINVTNVNLEWSIKRCKMQIYFRFLDIFESCT